MIDKVNHYTLLHGFYGQLLTLRQQEVFELYYHQDWSFGEIAGYYQISRAAIYDLLKRVEKQLDNYEEKLRLVEKFTIIDQELEGLLHTIENPPAKGLDVEKIRKKVREIIQLSRE